MRKRRNGHKCWYRLCENRVPHAQQYCSAACQQAAKREAVAPAPTYAPIALYVRAPQPNRKHSTDRRDGR